MQFNEPVKSQTFSFELIARSALELSPYQRSFASALVNKLTTSISNGFLVPVLMVRKDGKNLIVDGQHRLRAADKVLQNDYQVPCIVLPEAFLDLPLTYNIEQKDNIRDITTKVHSLYVDYTAKSPEIEENSLGKAVLYTPYYLSIAFAFMEYALSSPSLVESAVKKLDREFLPKPLSEAIIERREMGYLVRNLEDVVYEQTEKYAIKDYNLKMAIISKSSQALWGRKRVKEDFYEGMSMLTDQIRNTDWSWMAGR